MGIKISELTPDANITGVELIPVSDGGAAKSVTTGGIKDFTIDNIEALAAAAGVTGADGVYLLKGGELKPVNIDHVAQYAIDKVWGKAGEDTVAGSHKLPLKDGNTEKTVTAANLAAYIRSAITAGVLDLSSLDIASLASGDLLLVNQGAVAKKTTLSAINSAIYAGLQTHVAGLAAVTTTNGSDALYLLQGGVGKRVTLSKLAELFASSTLTGTGVVLRIGSNTNEGLETFVVDTVVELGMISGVDAVAVPVGAIIKSVQANLQEEAVADGTSVKVGIGITGTVDKYGLTTNLQKNQKINILLTPVVLQGVESIKVFPCASNGAVGDSDFTAGSIRVRVVYDQLASLVNAE